MCFVLLLIVSAGLVLAVSQSHQISAVTMVGRILLSLHPPLPSKQQLLLPRAEIISYVYVIQQGEGGNVKRSDDFQSMVKEQELG